MSRQFETTSLDCFIKDLELFNKLEEAGLGNWVQDEFVLSGKSLFLVFAAHDLLEALEACVDYGSLTGDDWVIDMALKAINKAKTGE